MSKKTIILIPLVIFLLGTIAILAKKFPILFNQANNFSQQLETNQFLDWRKSKEKLPQKEEEASLVAVGDISFSRGVERVVKARKNTNYPFLKIRDYLKNSDSVFGNLETPIKEGREIADGEMIFRSNPGTEKALKEAGLAVLSLANNHTPDFGESGLRDTFRYLENEGIKYVGAGNNFEEANKTLYIEVKGIKLAFLAYNDPKTVPKLYEASENQPGTAFMKREKMMEAVREAKQKADLVIVSMHSGDEYTPEPNNFQIDFAHSAIEAGADLIIGHHPHVIQTLEEYQGKYIFYSLGNFIFDQMWSQETREGLTIKVYLTKDGIKKISFLPVIIEDFSQPRPATESEAEKILQRLKFPLAKRTVYFWESNQENFVKMERRAIYKEASDAVSFISKETSADLDSDSILETYTLKNGQLKVKEISQQIWQSPTEWRVDDFTLADIDNDGQNDLIVIEGSHSNARKCQENHVAVWKWNGWGFSNEWRSERGNFCHLEIEKIEQKSSIVVDSPPPAL